MEAVFGVRSKPRSDPYGKFSNTLARRHRNFRRLVRTVGPLPYRLPIWKSIDHAVLYAVIGQMLSLSAACTIMHRLLRKYGAPAKVIRWAHRTRDIKGPLDGVPQRKRRALSEWYQYARRNKRCHWVWRKNGSDDFRREIVNLWGFGHWSADMIGIFYLGRMNIWPQLDAGLLRACRQVIGTDDEARIRRYVKGCETVAALYLWESLDNRRKTG